MCCWFSHLLSLPRSPRLSFVSSVVFSWSPSFLSSQRANADSKSASALVVVPSATKKNIGQWEAVSALTTPQQRLHEREILIHKADSALTTPQERLHERELLLIQKSSSAITNYSTRAPVSTNENSSSYTNHPAPLTNYSTRVSVSTNKNSSSTNHPAPLTLQERLSLRTWTVPIFLTGKWMMWWLSVDGVVNV